MSAVPRRQLLGAEPDVLAEILRDEVNLCVWRRRLSAEVEGFVDALLERAAPLAEAFSLEADAGGEFAPPRELAGAFAALPGHAAFVADVAWLLQAYACLLGARRIGLRLRALEQAMCPRFHIDQVPLRLVTTYAGPGSQWLPGALPVGAAEPAGIRQLGCGAVALLKGARWEGNEQGAIVHRSPALAAGERRLLLTLDWLA